MLLLLRLSKNLFAIPVFKLDCYSRGRNYLLISSFGLIAIHVFDIRLPRKLFPEFKLWSPLCFVLASVSVCRVIELITEVQCGGF